MGGIQLEFNIDNKSPEEVRLSQMHSQIAMMEESMGKVRRKLFSEMSEMKKLYADLKKENEELKTMLKELKNEKTEWAYGENGRLFDVREYREAIG